MFRNSYHPVSLLGGLVFFFGLMLFSFAIFLFLEVILKYWNYDNNWSPQAPEILSFVALLTGGILTLYAGIGIMMKKQLAKRIANFVCLFCIAGGVILLCLGLLTAYKISILAIVLATSIAACLGSVFLLTILILNGEIADEYFGDRMVDTHKNLLDNI